MERVAVSLPCKAGNAVDTESHGATVANISSMDDLDELALVDGLLCDAKNVERQRHQAGDSDICPFCANFDFSEVLSPPHSQEHLGWPEPTLEDVKISASSGCPSCDVLCKVVEDFGLEMSLSQAVGKMSLASEPQVRIKHSYTDQGDPNGFLSLGLVAEVIRKKRRNKKPRYVASKLIDISQLPRSRYARLKYQLTHTNYCNRSLDFASTIASRHTLRTL